jgi:hypothetical protein
MSACGRFTKAVTNQEEPMLLDGAAHRDILSLDALGLVTHRFEYLRHGRPLKAADEFHLAPELL